MTAAEAPEVIELTAEFVDLVSETNHGTTTGVVLVAHE
jgi:hypothetical protein